MGGTMMITNNNCLKLPKMKKLPHSDKYTINKVKNTNNIQLQHKCYFKLGKTKYIQLTKLTTSIEIKMAENMLYNFK